MHPLLLSRPRLIPSILNKCSRRRILLASGAALVLGLSPATSVRAEGKRSVHTRCERHLWS